MTKEEFLEMWKNELKDCEASYRSDQERNRAWYQDYHNGKHRRGGPPRMPDHTLFRNRLSSRLYIYEKDLAENEIVDIKRAATTMMLDKLREMDVEIKYAGDLENFIKLDPKNIQYMELLSWQTVRESFLAEMVTQNPEVLSFLSVEQFREISKGNPDFVLQLVKGNAELANRPPLSEIIAGDPALTKEITILKKEGELEKLKVAVDEKKQELEELKGKEEKEVQTPTEIE